MLRLIAGTLRGRRLITPEGLDTRPTADRVKESLFNIMQGHITGASVLDMFAGSGNLGIEAISRGADRAVFVDSSHKSVRCIQDNIKTLALSTNTQVLLADFKTALMSLARQGLRFDIIFADPPYKAGLYSDIIALVFEQGLLTDDGVLVLEHPSTMLMPQLPHCQYYDTRKYGDISITFARSEDKDVL